MGLGQADIAVLTQVVRPASLGMLKIVQLQNKVDQLADLSKKTPSSKVEGVGRG